MIAIPGHSQGSVCLLEEGSGILFCGDGVIGDGFFGGTPQICNFDAYIASMEKLKAVSPSLAVTAHTDTVEGKDWQSLLQRSIDCARRMLAASERYAREERGGLRIGAAAAAIAKSEGKTVGGGTCVTALAALRRMADPRAQTCIAGYLQGV